MGKETDRQRKLLYIAALLLICLVFSGIKALAEKSDEKMLGVHLDSRGGRSASSDFSMVEGVLNTINSYGYNVKLSRFSSDEDVMDAFLAKKIHAAWLWPGQAVEIMASGRKIHPSMTYLFGKNDRVSYCLWNKKGAGGNNISVVNGKKLIVVDGNPLVLVQLREFLASKGIDKPLWQVFGSLIYSKNSNSAYMALTAGDADFVWDTNDAAYFLKILNPNVAAQLTKNFCTESIYARGSIVIDESRSGTEFCNQFDADVKDMLKNFKKYANKEQGLRALAQYLKLASARIVMSKPDKYNNDYKLYLKAKENGWLAEADFIHGKMTGAPPGKAMEIKMDYKTCRTMCAKNKDEMNCISACMK